MVRVVGDKPNHSFTIGYKGEVKGYHNESIDVCIVELFGLSQPLNTNIGDNKSETSRQFFEMELELDKNETVRSIIADL